MKKHKETRISERMKVKRD